MLHVIAAPDMMSCGLGGEHRTHRRKHLGLDQCRQGLLDPWPQCTQYTAVDRGWRGRTWPSEGTVDSVMRRPRVLASRSAFTRLTVLVVICAPGTVSQPAPACHSVLASSCVQSMCCSCAELLHIKQNRPCRA